MSRPARMFGSLVLTLAIAVCVGIALWGAVATALDLPPVVGDALESAAGAAGDLGVYVIASAAIGAIVLFARKMWPSHFAPQPATETSRRRCMTLAVLVGQLGAFGGAFEPIRPGVAGTVFAGLIVAAIAVFGRDYMTRARGAAEEKRAAKDEPEVTPGPLA